MERLLQNKVGGIAVHRVLETRLEEDARIGEARLRVQPAVCASDVGGSQTDRQ